MKLALKNLAWPKMHRHELLVVIPLGLTGFLFNIVELPVGLGMRFMFGNAIIFAFIRVLAPQSLVLAISISGLWTVFLWNHPWAWLVWIFEAIFCRGPWSAQRTGSKRCDFLGHSRCAIAVSDLRRRNQDGRTVALAGDA